MPEVDSFDVVSADEGNGNQKIHTSSRQIIKHWPYRTLFIIGNEFCERFSFYGMRTVLTLYLLNQLRFDDKTATVFFNGFAVICYLSPIFGSILADSFVGLFWTIVSLSMVYTGGQVILAVSAVQQSGSIIHPWLDLLGLFIIAIGTGGIKPCVAPFGAQQFQEHQTKMISLYFSMFYFSINAGATLSTYITPIFRLQRCFGQDSCYSLAFAVPAFLMIIATALFVVGGYWYDKSSVTRNIFQDLFVAVTTALRNKFNADRNHMKRNHWLDYYFVSHECSDDRRCIDLKKENGDEDACDKVSLILDIKSLLRVIVMYIPLPMFWALFDQQGSTWMIQALQMDSRIWGNFLLLPDQMQMLNALLILLYIPIFQAVVYPVMEKIVVVTPLRKMGVGCCLASLAFFMSSAVQYRINQDLPLSPDFNQSFVTLVSTLGNCEAEVTVNGLNGTYLISLANAQDFLKTADVHWLSTNAGLNHFVFDYSNETCDKSDSLPKAVNFNINAGKYYTIVLTRFGIYISENNIRKPHNGNGEFSLTIQMAMSRTYQKSLKLCESHKADNLSSHGFLSQLQCYEWLTENDITTSERYSGGDELTNKLYTLYTYKTIRPGRYNLFFADETTVANSYPSIAFEINDQGGVYTLIVTGDSQKLDKHLVQIVSENKVSISWQVPQYMFITGSEVLFSISGLEFAYSEAAPSVKSIVQALWLLTVSIGDLMIVLIALWDPFTNTAVEFFSYAILMAITVVIFALLSTFYYEYNDSVHAVRN